MRVILASLLVVLVTPAFAQTVGALPPEFLSPTLMQGWQAQPAIPTAEEQTQLVLQWAGEPGGLVNRSGKSDRELGRQRAGHRASTVGQAVSH
jgi:hypothetical protein